MKFWLPIKSPEGIINRNLTWSICIAFLCLTFGNPIVNNSNEEEEVEIEIYECVISDNEKTVTEQTQRNNKNSKWYTVTLNILTHNYFISKYTQKLYLLFCQLSIHKTHFKNPIKLLK